MTKLREIYRCQVCKNVVEVVSAGGPSPFCCGKEMELLVAKTEDKGTEKHVPVVEEKGGKIQVTVGEVDHPMEADHFILFIEVLTEKMVHRAELAPGEKPQAEFSIPLSQVKEIREYCNLHGLWKK